MEKITDALRDMGFDLNKVDTVGYEFQYEGINFLYMPNDNDEDYLSISVPGIVDKGDIPDDKYKAVQEDVNANLKYVKAYTLGDSCWLFYERELFGGENMEELVTRMILRLEAAAYYVKKALSSDDDNGDGDDSTDGESEEPASAETDGK